MWRLRAKPGLISSKRSEAMAVNVKPAGYHTLTPYLVVEGAGRLIEFLEEVFDATVQERLAAPGNRIGHAQLQIGDSIVMLSDAGAEHTPMPAMLYVYVDDVDATFQRALAAGATQVQPPTDQFYGDRSGGVKDPCGNQWWIATHIEDVPPDELRRRAQQRMQQAARG
ncbi:MAG TPA: VOC family protein [Acetobacteraceae bacterium]